MEKVRNIRTGEVGLASFSEFTTVVYALPKYDYEIMGRVIARYKTRKNFWQRWEVVK